MINIRILFFLILTGLMGCASLGGNQAEFQLIQTADPVVSMAFSPEGEVLVSGGHDRTVKLWDIKERKELFVIDAHPGRVSAVAFSPDGKFFGSGSEGGEVKIWDAATGDPVIETRGHSSQVSWLAFHPTLPVLASASKDFTIRFWDTKTGEPTRLLSGGHTKAVMSIDFSPDGKYLASAGFDGKVVLWDAQKGTKLSVLGSYKNSPYRVKFSSDGEYLTATVLDEKLKMWETGEFKMVNRFTGEFHSDIVWGLQFNRDGSQLLSADRKGVVKIWDVATGSALKHIYTGIPYIWEVLFTPGEQSIAIAHGKGISFYANPVK